jgi:hypothetical protein
MGAAVGLALTIVRFRIAWAGLASFAISALLAMFLPLPEGALSMVFTAFWLSTIAAACLVLIPGTASPWLAIILAINGGVWSGMLTTVTGARSPLALALLFALFFVPGRWFRCGGREIVLKVLSSWLIAVSALAALVSLVPTPGYEPDHME